MAVVAVKMGKRNKWRVSKINNLWLGGIYLKCYVPVPIYSGEVLILHAYCQGRDDIPHYFTTCHKVVDKCGLFGLTSENDYLLLKLK